MPFGSLLDAVVFHASATPGKVCLVEAESGRKYTYGEFWAKVMAFSKYLNGIGIKKGTHVMVRVGSFIETFVVQFGIYLSGCVYCPVERGMKQLRVIEMLDYLDARVLISTERVLFDGVWIDLSTVCRYEEDGVKEHYDSPDVEDVCAIVFTTGTTGKAKGVMISYKANMNASKARHDAYGFTAKDIFLWVQPLDRSSGIRVFGPAFISGATVVHYDGVIFVNDIIKAILDNRVTVVCLQSFALNIFFKASPDVFLDCREQLRVIFFSGGVVSESQKNHLIDILPQTRLFVNYSSTEMPAIACYEINSYPNKPNCVGKIFPNSRLYFVDDKGEQVEDVSKDNPAIIAYESDRVMSGYWKDPVLTARTLINGRIIMTDMGYIGDDGFLYIVGRRDDVIVSGGHKIAPYEIENVVMQMMGISECVCVSEDSKVLGKMPKLYVVMKKNAQFTANEILKYLSERIEAYKLPRVIREIDNMPRVGNTLKIDRKALREYE